MPDKAEVKKIIITHLKAIFDPEIPVNIWDLGLIYGVEVDDEYNAIITMTFTSPNCPAMEILPDQIRQSVELIQEIAEVDIHITWDPPWNASLVPEEIRLELGLL